MLFGVHSLACIRIQISIWRKMMKTAEKKLGFFKGTIRQNFLDFSIVGTIEGDVTRLKGGRRMVSADKEGNLIFWIVNDFDIIVSAEEVVSCKIVDSGKRGAPCGSSNSGVWYGPVFELTFVNGSTGRLVVNEFCVEGAEYRNADVADIPHVDGWLAPDGTRDAHFNDALCPDGYKPNIVGYFREKSSSGKMSKVDNALKLKERFPEIFGADGKPKGLYVFNGSKSTYYIRKK